MQKTIGVALSFGLLYLLLSISVFLITGDQKALMVGAAVGPVMLLLLPQLFQSSADLLAPLNFLALSAFFGTTLRTLYVATVENEYITDVLLLGKPPEFLLPAVLVINLSVACLVLGYVVELPPIPLHLVPLFRRGAWSPVRVRWMVSVLFAIGAACVVLYVDRLQLRIEQLADLSAKRRLEVDGGEHGYAALGYYLWGMSLFSYAFFLLWARFSASRKPLKSLAGLSVMAFALLAVIPPFLTSSRTGVLIVLVYAAIIWNYARRPISGRWLLAAVLAGVLALTLMAGLRGLGRRTNPTDVAVNPATVSKAVLGNRNWLGVTKTAHLLDAVPRELEFQNGRTFLTWLAAPVPRTLWPEKPVIRFGIILSSEVFQSEGARTGVPPGFVGELYLNFGYPGVFSGMLLLGLLLRLLYASFWPLLRSNMSALLVYTVLMFQLSFALVTTDVSGVVIELARSLITLGILLTLVAEPRQCVPEEL